MLSFNKVLLYLIKQKQLIMEFKGTKVEWTAQSSKYDLEVPVKKGKQWFIMDGEHAIHIISGKTSEQIRANAHLIAASPELLEALQNLIKWSAHLPQAANGEIEAANKALEKALNH